jgi:hypothetical protein
MANYLSDSFTGSNGAAWNSSNWTVTSGGTATIQDNKGQMAPSSGSPIVIATVPTIPADFSFTGQLELSTNLALTTITYRFNSAGTIGYRLLILYDTILLYSDNAGSGSTLIGYAGGLRYQYDAYILSYGSGSGTPLPTAGSLLAWDDDQSGQSQGVVEGSFPRTGTSTTGTVRVVTSSHNGGPNTNPVNGSTGVYLLPPTKWQATNVAWTDFYIVNFRLEVSGTSHKFRFWPKYDASGAIATEPTTWTFNLTDTVSTTQTNPIEIKYSDPAQVAGFLDNVSIDSVAASADKTVTSGVSVGVTAVSTVRPEPSAATRIQVGAATRSQPTISVTVGTLASVGVLARAQPTVLSDVTTTSGVSVGAITVSTVRPELSVASRAQVGVGAVAQPSITASVATLAGAGVVARTQPTISVSVSAVAGVGVATNTQLGVSGDVTVTSGLSIGAATRSQPTISVNVVTVAVAGTASTSQAQVSISVASLTAVGVGASSLVSAVGDVTTTSAIGVGVRTGSTVRPEPTATASIPVGALGTSQPTISVTAASVTMAAAVLLAGAQIAVSTSSRVAVGAFTISSLPGGSIVVSFGPLILFLSPAPISYAHPATIQYREPRTVRT